MTARWTTADAIRDASDMRAEHDSTMRAEATGHADDWADDERPTRAEAADRPWSREQWMETGNGYY